MDALKGTQMQMRLVKLGIKCDADGCDFTEELDGLPEKSDIGRPCPKCGASLLTEEDYKAAVDFLAMVDTLNESFGKMTPEPAKGDTTLKVSATLTVNPRHESLGVEVDDIDIKISEKK